jgi:2-amino-4-hydroxy-6-hydroxymethyldihydropteridine diphosphokinase
MNDVFLLLGSNMGERNSFLLQAMAGIKKEVGKIVKASSVYETQAWGKTNEADYLNQVLLVQTMLQPRALLNSILQIELSLGRKREVKWGARTIDIDILFYNDGVVNESGLLIPHPELQNRRFTLEPLAEIAPGFMHPVLQKSMLQLKNELQDGLIVKKL